MNGKIVCCLFVAAMVSGLAEPDIQAGPVVSVPQDLNLVPGEQAVIPVNILNLSGYELGGYVLRIHYNETVLSNPEAVVDGTQSESSIDGVKTVEHPVDGIGVLSVGVFVLTPNESEVLVKIRFDVAPDYNEESPMIGFESVNRKTTLFTGGFDQIPAEFSPQVVKNRGDIDGNGEVELVDAIVGLKVMVGLPVVPGDPAVSDVNYDMKTGLHEVLYVLNYISGFDNR